MCYGALGATGVGLALFAFYLLSRTAQDAGEFDQLQNVILLVNIAGAIALLALLAGNLYRLVRDYRAHVPGAKLKARMVAMFVGLAALQLLIVFYFAMQFINRGIDTWFNVEVEAGLDDALALSQASLGAQMRDHLNTTILIAERVHGVGGRELILQLGLLRRESGASEITVYG
ncbi:MAG: sensor histidine kinase, partial [Woeseiaceae bacterium]